MASKVGRAAPSCACVAYSATRLPSRRSTSAVRWRHSVCSESTAIVRACRMRRSIAVRAPDTFWLRACSRFPIDRRLRNFGTASLEVVMQHNTGALAAAAWLTARDLQANPARWHVEIALDVRPQPASFDVDDRSASYFRIDI